jgi:hypothetical protein
MDTKRKSSFASNWHVHASAYECMPVRRYEKNGKKRENEKDEKNLTCNHGNMGYMYTRKHGDINR